MSARRPPRRRPVAVARPAKTAVASSDTLSPAGELERRVRELDRIYDLADAVSRAASLDEIYTEALASLTDVLGAPRAAVLLFDAAGVMRFQASHGLSHDYRQKAEGHSPWTAETKNPQPVLIEDATSEPALAPLAEVILGEGIRGLGFFPLVDEGLLLGKLMVYYDSPHSFSREERQLAATVARHVAFGIARKRAHDALRDNETRLAALARSTDLRQRMQFAVTQVLAEASTLPDAVPRLLQAICETLGWDIGSMWMVDRAANRLRCAGVWRIRSPDFFSFEKITRDFEFPVGMGVPGRVWESGKSAWISDVGEDSNFPRARAAADEGIRSACGFPIETRGKVIGVIEFFSREKRPPDRDLMKALEDLGRRIGQFVQRKQAEAAFREQEESYRALFDVNPVPMWLRDPETLTFAAVNDAAVRQYGYSQKEFLQMTVRDILAPEERTALAPDFHWDPSHGIEPWNAGLRRHRRKDGTFIWVEVTGRDIVIGERRLRLILANDVTERKRVDDEHRFLAEASALLGSSLDSEATLAKLARRSVPELGDWCVFDVADPQGIPVRVAGAVADPTNEEVLGRYPPNPLSRHGVYEVLRTGESEFVPEVSPEMLDRVAWDAEHAQILKNFVHGYLCVPMRAGNRVLGAMTLVRTKTSARYEPRDVILAEEVARRAGLAVENARLYAEMRDASAQKSRFLSAVSHDLRTPANAITLLSSLIRKETEQTGAPDATRLLERCRRLETASSAFADLLSDLLEIGSFDSGQKKLREEDFALSEVIEESLETCAAAAREKDLRLRVRWDIAPPGIRGDRTEFNRVLMNLVSNAIKFTQRGFVKVEISKTSDGDLQIGVRDTGPGIPPEHLSAVFSEFFQVQNDERDRSKGSGLGLAISRRIMQALGGSLRVESQIGVGSLFTATLPASRVLSEPPGRGEQPADATRAQNVLTNGASVLLIDDDATSREALTELLEEEGYEVLSASGGEEGLEAARRHRPDLLLLDMMMPGIDGVEVIRRIRSEPALKRLRIIALTGDVTRTRLQNVFEAGADRFVAKPFRIQELLESVRTMLRAPA